MMLQKSGGPYEVLILFSEALQGGGKENSEPQFYCYAKTGDKRNYRKSCPQ